jgi:PTS system cellobiose-specific IIB component
MKRVMLVCSAGMSTSLLVTKMNLAAHKQGLKLQIQAVSEAECKNQMNQADVLLLGPQVRFLLDQLRKAAAPAGVPVEVIDSADYGTMNGERVLQQALRLME